MELIKAVMFNHPKLFNLVKLKEVPLLYSINLPMFKLHNCSSFLINKNYNHNYHQLKSYNKRKLNELTVLIVKCISIQYLSCQYIKQ